MRKDLVLISKDELDNFVTFEPSISSVQTPSN